MFRQVALGLGLVLNFVGLIVFLIDVRNFEYFGYYIDFGIPHFLAIGLVAAIVGFLLLFFGIVYPHPTPEPAPKKDDIRE
jgi:hypothetical protein